MQLLADIPTKFNIPFADAAAAGFIRPIPEASQITVQAGAASLTDGFPPVCFLPVGAGGTPPWGQDMNGILNPSTAWNRWQNAGAPVPYDGTFSAAIGGYPLGAIVAAALPNYFWLNLADDNLTNPETGGSGWQLFSPISISTGDWKWRPTAETLVGWVKANATTIGNASSNATQLATAETWNLFEWHWTNFSNTQCPVFTSAGAPSTRGASAAADYAANKTIQVLDLRGTMGGLGMDTMGGSPTTRLTGVPATSGSATAPGSVLGENLHAMLLAENGPHGHGVTDPTHFHTITSLAVNSTTAAPSNFGGVGTSGVSNPVTNSVATNISINTSGSGTAHNTVSRAMTGTIYLKL